MISDIVESLLREVNGQIYRLTRYFDGDSEYICECGAEDCHIMLALSSEEFGAILTEPGHRLVAPGHESVDSVAIRAGDGYVVVTQQAAQRTPAA